MIYCLAMFAAMSVGALVGIVLSCVMVIGKDSDHEARLNGLRQTISVRLRSRQDYYGRFRGSEAVSRAFQEARDIVDAEWETLCEREDER